MIGPLEAFGRDPDDFAVNLWANVAGSAIVIGAVVLLIILFRPAAPAAVEAVIEAS